MSYDPRFDQNSWLRPTYGGAVPGIDVDLGLRRYMLQVYNFMAAGLGVTGLVAYAAVATGFYQQIVGTPLTGWSCSRRSASTVPELPHRPDEHRHRAADPPRLSSS